MGARRHGQRPARPASPTLRERLRPVHAAAAPCSARLHHGEPPAPASGAEPQPFPLRFADFDVVGHVNNAVYWTVVEEVLRRPLGPAGAAAGRGRAPAPRSRPEATWRSTCPPDDGLDGAALWMADADGVTPGSVGRRLGLRPGAGAAGGEPRSTV